MKGFAFAPLAAVLLSTNVADASRLFDCTATQYFEVVGGKFVEAEPTEKVFGFKTFVADGESGLLRVPWKAEPWRWVPIARDIPETDLVLAPPRNSVHVADTDRIIIRGWEDPISFLVTVNHFHLTVGTCTAR